MSIFFFHFFAQSANILSLLRIAAEGFGLLVIFCFTGVNRIFLCKCVFAELYRSGCDQ